jgi:hypothetical protein
MKSIILLIVLLYVAAACIYGCSDADVKPDIPVNTDPEPSEQPEYSGCPFKFPPSVAYPLAGTQWNLVGSLTATTGELTVYKHPKECTDCYTLEFDTDSTATLHNVQDRRIDLFHLDTCLLYAITYIGFTEEINSEVADPKLVNVIMETVGSYTATSHTLLLYYYFGKEQLNYLLFNRKES